MKRLFLLLLIISAYAIAACSAPATTAPIVAGSAPSSTINIDNLPLNVDVATVRALQERDDVVLIDVREPEEYAAGHIPDYSSSVSIAPSHRWCLIAGAPICPPSTA